MERLRAVRGATTLDEDTRDQVVERTGTLLKEIIDRNRLDPDAIVSIMFTATEDIHSEFPAVAARSMGLLDVPLICARELAVTGAVTLCIRVLVSVYSETPRSELRHVYLERATPLRTDLHR
ncbi:MAG TPA: chorismate mutase [Actinomycetota bacterium]